MVTWVQTLDMMDLRNRRVFKFSTLDTVTEQEDELRVKLELHFAMFNTYKTISAIRGSMDVQASAESSLRGLVTVGHNGALRQEHCKIDVVHVDDPHDK